MKSIAQREKESKNNNNILKYNNEEINILSYYNAKSYDNIFISSLIYLRLLLPFLCSFSL